jgi:hypothetical protein
LRGLVLIADVASYDKTLHARIRNRLNSDKLRLTSTSRIDKDKGFFQRDVLLIPQKDTLSLLTPVCLVAPHNEFATDERKRFCWICIEYLLLLAQYMFFQGTEKARAEQCVVK